MIVCDRFLRRNLWKRLALAFLVCFGLSEAAEVIAEVIVEEATYVDDQDELQDQIDAYLDGLAEPSPDLKAFYQLTGLSHWPFQYALGDLGVTQGRITKPKVVVLVYSSMSCSHCADLHLKTILPLRKKYPEEVCIVVRDRPLDLFSFQATLLTYCHSDKVHEIQKTLFARQTDWMPTATETKDLSRREAHQLIRAKLGAIVKDSDFSEEHCAPFFSARTLRGAAKRMNQNTAFKAIRSTPLVYLYVPQRTSKSTAFQYAAPQSVPAASLTFPALEALINTERAKRMR